jgi:large subunit ribosomal protein L30
MRRSGVEGVSSTVRVQAREVTMAKIRITQTKSGMAAPEKHRKTLQALGLKHQRAVVLDDNDAIRNLIFQVRHLVSVETAPERGSSLSAFSSDPYPTGFVSAASEVAPSTFPFLPERLAAMADYHRARRGFTSDVELAEALGVHRSRLAAWKRGLVAPSHENARMLSHLAVTVAELEGFLDHDVIPDWLLSEQYTLGGRTPTEALREGRLAEVLYAANATEHGAYV